MGLKYSEEVLAAPSKMPPDFSWCESLLSVAPDAWAEVTEDESMNFDHNCAEKSFETCSNEAAWAEPSWKHNQALLRPPSKTNN